jgi:transposase InsO family protein
MKSIPRGTRFVYLGTTAKADILGVGDYILKLRGGGKLVLKDTVYAPNMRKNLISVSKLESIGYSVLFGNSQVKILLNGNLVQSGDLFEGLYYINDICNDGNMHCLVGEHNSVVRNINSNNNCSESYLWHLRLGHISKNRIKRLISSGILDFNWVDYGICEACIMGKMTRAPFPKAMRAEEPLAIIHSDICGEMSTPTFGQKIYFITFIDDYSRFGYVYLLKHKSEGFDMFKVFKAEVENQLNKKIKVLRTDRGGEYTSGILDEFCKEHGIIHHYTLPYTPQQNGVAERRNRTLMDMVRSMMAYSDLPLSFWGEALHTAVYLLNHTPSKAVKVTPYELWKGRKPTLRNLAVWGCNAQIKVPSQNRTKLQPKSTPGIFIGYCSGSNGYRFYDPENRKVLESRDAIFLDQDTPRRAKRPRVELLVDNSGHSENISNTEEPNPIEQDEPSTSMPRRSGRNAQTPSYLDDYFTFLGEVHSKASLEEEPKSFKQAMGSPESSLWMEAMQEELNSMKKNNVWELVNLPNNRKTIGSKWIFKRKRNASGLVEKYKARLVAKGYTQREGIDFVETFSPVAKFTSIRILSALTAYFDLELHQMDVKTAFLNGYLEEEIYMVQPDGFVEKGNEDKVCKLNRSIYGLKQASRQWYKLFDNAITSYGFSMTEEDHCIYLKIVGESFVMLSLYVDDILIASNNKGTLLEVKSWLSSSFDMKDMGEASYVLGVEIHRNRDKKVLGLSQKAYLNAVLKRFAMENCNPVTVPMVRGTKLSEELCPKTPEEIKKMKDIPYSSALGSLMYAMLFTRPDLCHTVGILSRYQQNPGHAHWKQIKYALRYIKGTLDYALCFNGQNLQLQGYTDADCQGDLDERKSTSGYLFTLAGGAISWKSKKQDSVALSSMESEYIAASEAVKEGVWLKEFLASLKIVESASKPVTIYCDNQAAMKVSRDPKFHSKSKHIEAKYHYIRDVINRLKFVQLEYLPSVNMVADPLTKSLSQEVFCRHVNDMGLRKFN